MMLLGVFAGLGAGAGDARSLRIAGVCRGAAQPRDRAADRAGGDSARSRDDGGAVRGLVLAAAGLALGVAGGWAATRAMTSVLYGVQPTDPSTFAAVVMLLGTVAFVACLVPAARAARVDPMVVLRRLISDFRFTLSDGETRALCAGRHHVVGPTGLHKIAATAMLATPMATHSSAAPVTNRIHRS